MGCLLHLSNQSYAGGNNWGLDSVCVAFTICMLVYCPVKLNGLVIGPSELIEEYFWLDWTARSSGPVIFAADYNFITSHNIFRTVLLELILPFGPWGHRDNCSRRSIYRGSGSAVFVCMWQNSCCVEYTLHLVSGSDWWRNFTSD